QHRVEIADLTEAVTPEFQRCGHETQTPLADVEGGAAVVIRRRIAIGHHHLREGHPVRNRPLPFAVAVAHGVQRHPLAMVEPDPKRPVLPLHQVAVEGERRALWLCDVQRLEGFTAHGRQDPFGDVPWHVFTHHLRRRGARAGTVWGARARTVWGARARTVWGARAR